MNPDAADEASDTAFGQLDHLTPSLAAAAWLDATAPLPSLAETSRRDSDTRTAAS